MRKLMLFALLAIVAPMTHATAGNGIEIRTVEVIGEGVDYDSAVDKALSRAVAQVYGRGINETRTVVSSQTQSGVSHNGVDDSSFTVSGATTSNISSKTSGRVESFDVLESTIDSSGQTVVRVAVHVPGEYVVGLDPANRRRMAVSVFRLGTGDTFRWNGAADSAEAWAQGLAGRINERLTQTRKFTVVDRKFDAEINAELNRLTAANASAADLGRLNRKMGTDYLVIGEVNFYSVQPPSINPLTGQAMPQVNQKFADVSYRVLLAPTGQLKWSDTITINSFDFPSADISSFATASADGVAMRIVDGIMANILPLEVVGKTPSGQLVIGEGGKSVSVGEVFTVYALGDEVYDSRTGELIDEIEEAVGDVQIVRVTPKASYAKVLGGDVSLMVPGSRLRRPDTPVETATPTAAPPPTTIRGVGNGGFVTPF